VFYLRKSGRLASEADICGVRGRITLPPTRLSPDDLDRRSGREVAASTSLQSAGGNDTRDLRALCEVVASAQRNEVRHAGSPALGVWIVMISVRWCVGATTSEDVEVFALIPRTDEAAGPFGERENSPGIESRSVSAASRDDDHDHYGDDQIDDDVSHATKCNSATPNSSQTLHLHCRSPWPRRCL